MYNKTYTVLGMKNRVFTIFVYPQELQSRGRNTLSRRGLQGMEQSNGGLL